MKKRVIIIGGGVAGMQTALRLAEQGVSPVIIEKEAELGGKLRGWHVLFPSFTPAQEVLTELRRRVNESGIEVMTSTEVAGFTKESVTLADGRTLPCDSVVVASGFTLFDASIKEEYGYGIYDNVFTTADIERMLNEGRVAKADGSRPRRIAFLHCVGSRDEKVCQQHCSKVCCITGVKQAMEMKQLFPEADVFNFYMDIRMFGPGYEEMYREAQQRYNIHFLRGRISEASPTIDGRVQIKAEDTLTGRPLRMSVDMLVLIVGIAILVDRLKNRRPKEPSESDIIDALFLWVKKAGVTIVHTTADELLIEDGVLTGVRAGHKTYKADRVIVATGGASYPQTGSTGDGYRMAQALGHMIVPPRGSLVPLESDSPDCAAMQGLALRNVELAVYSKKTKPLFREFGEMLFTHFGVSGPLVLSASAHLRNWDKERYRLVIDLKPALDEQKLESRILRDIAENPNRDMDKILSGLVPRSMVPVVLRRCGLPPEEKANSLTREQRRALVQLLTHFEIPVTGPRPVREAIITSGGVKVGEVQPATMESKLVRGLFFAGEILDTDAYTGGFNLQIAWATGHCAGCAAAEYKEMQQ